MLAKTHKIIAKNIIKNINADNKFLIIDKSFIRGNLKPDNFSSYKLKKHYKKESFDMIINKAIFLSSLSYKEIIDSYGKKKFNQELGVVCHFLADYFCLAHEERWEFKRRFKSHVQYEVILGRIAKNYVFDASCSESNLNINYVGNFVNKNLREYEKVKGFEADIIFAQYVCNSVVQSILENVCANTKKKTMVI